MKQTEERGGQRTMKGQSRREEDNEGDPPINSLEPGVQSESVTSFIKHAPLG